MNPTKLQLNAKCRVSGRFRLLISKGDANGDAIPGTQRDATGWINNLITNNGLNQLGDTSPYSGGWYRGCAVGTGSTAPAFTDTTLATRVAATVTVQAHTSGRDIVSADRYVYARRTFRFGTGVAAGNLTEVGIVMGTSDGTGTDGAMNPTSYKLFSRALIVDGGGSPTTVTVLGDEVLDVEYEVRMYMPAAGADVTGIIALDGINYDYIVRPWRIEQNPATNSGGWAVETSSGGKGARFENRTTVGYGENAIWTGVTAGIGAESSADPTGTKVGLSGGPSTAAYVDGSYYSDITQTWPLGTALTAQNAAGGIGAMAFSTPFNSFQVDFTPHIPKSHTQVLAVTLRFSWARH